MFDSWFLIKFHAKKYFIHEYFNDNLLSHPYGSSKKNSLFLGVKWKMQQFVYPTHLHVLREVWVPLFYLILIEPMTLVELSSSFLPNVCWRLVLRENIEKISIAWKFTNDNYIWLKADHMLHSGDVMPVEAWQHSVLLLAEWNMMIWVTWHHLKWIRFANGKCSSKVSRSILNAVNFN